MHGRTFCFLANLRLLMNFSNLVFYLIVACQLLFMGFKTSHSKIQLSKLSCRKSFHGLSHSFCQNICLNFTFIRFFFCLM